MADDQQHDAITVASRVADIREALDKWGQYTYQHYTDGPRQASEDVAFLLQDREWLIERMRDHIIENNRLRAQNVSLIERVRLWYWRRKRIAAARRRARQ